MKHISLVGDIQEKEEEVEEEQINIQYIHKEDIQDMLLGDIQNYFQDLV